MQLKLNYVKKEKDEYRRELSVAEKRETWVRASETLFLSVAACQYPKEEGMDLFSGQITMERCNLAAENVGMHVPKELLAKWKHTASFDPFLAFIDEFVKYVVKIRCKVAILSLLMHGIHHAREGVGDCLFFTGGQSLPCDWLLEKLRARIPSSTKLVVLFDVCRTFACPENELDDKGHEVLLTKWDAVRGYRIEEKRDRRDWKVDLPRLLDYRRNLLFFKANIPFAPAYSHKRMGSRLSMAFTDCLEYVAKNEGHASLDTIKTWVIAKTEVLSGRKQLVQTGGSRKEGIHFDDFKRS